MKWTTTWLLWGVSKDEIRSYVFDIWLVLTFIYFMIGITNLSSFLYLLIVADLSYYITRHRSFIKNKFDKKLWLCEFLGVIDGKEMKKQFK